MNEILQKIKVKRARRKKEDMKNSSYVIKYVIYERRATEVINFSY